MQDLRGIRCKTYTYREFIQDSKKDSYCDSVLNDTSLNSKPLCLRLSDVVQLRYKPDFHPWKVSVLK